MENLKLDKIYDGPIYIRIIILIVVSIGLLLLAYFFDYKSLNTQYAANQDKIESVKDQFKSLIRKEMALENDTEEFNQLTLVYTQLKKQISPYSNINKVIDEILKAGSYNNIYFTNFNPNAEIKKGSYIIVPIKINGVASYKQLASFVSQISAMPYIIYIGDFTIVNENSLKAPSAVPNDVPNNGNTLAASFDMEVYSHVQ